VKNWPASTHRQFFLYPSSCQIQGKGHSIGNTGMICFPYSFIQFELMWREIKKHGLRRKLVSACV